MAKKAVDVQERLEKLIAGAAANPDGPQINVQQLQGYIDVLNRREYELNQAKLALKQATQARDTAWQEAVDAAVKTELAVKAHYGPRSLKVREYVSPRSHPKTKKAPAG